MNLTIELQPDLERSLLARAQAKGVSLADFAQEVLAREVQPASDEKPGSHSNAQADNLYDLLAPVRGLLTNEEVDTYFARTPSSSRPVGFE